LELEDSVADNTGSGTQYDVVVLGAGSGGYACALRAAQLGLKTALIEKDKIGGTCLHWGCIPTKALLHAAEVADEVNHGASVGVNATLDSIDMSQVNAYKDGVVGGLYKGLQGLIKAAAIDVFEGEGKLVSADTVEVSGQRVSGKNVVLATGSYARTLPGLELGGRVMTSYEALQLDRVPASAVVIGGSVIGVEFASAWRSLGVDVTIVEALPTWCRWRRRS
jgi:dihydrolipoamide dehydrogenase